jgi:hypothetical protein
MTPSVTLRSVALVRTNVSEEPNAQLISYETLVLKIFTRRNIREDGILHSHRRENLKPYM